MKQFTRTLTALILSAAVAYAAESITPDLKAAPEGKGWKPAPKATCAWVAEAKGKSALKVKGILWLDGVTFANGVIECDILGQSNPPQSNFLGIAFRGADHKTFDCVYFRPFNFRATNPEKASHAVQYVSHPQWTWSRLRQERTGQYEKPIQPPPDGDAWFHARIVVADKKVSVFVNDATTPSLEVKTLNDRTSGQIGIWTDANTSGHFANLKITTAK